MWMIGDRVSVHGFEIEARRMLLYTSRVTTSRSKIRAYVCLRGSAELYKE